MRNATYGPLLVPGRRFCFKAVSLAARAGWVAALLAAALFLATSAMPALAQQASDWAGEWDTRWRDGGARVIFEQEGDRVTGVYPLYGGRIEARADGRTLRGRWIEGQRQGRFVFIQSRGGRTFTGRFETGEWWTGIRAAAVPRPNIPVDQSSPMTTLRTFLRAANEIGPGTMDLLGTAASVMEPDENAQAGVDRLDHARLLFEVLDLLTFRLWELPHHIDGESRTVRLEQFGTDAHFDLDFRRIGNRWFIAAPPSEALRAKRSELRAARGITVDALQDPRDLKTPRDTFKTFFAGMNTQAGEVDNPAHATLNTSALSEVVRGRETPLLARYLKQVMDRIGFVMWQEIPNDPDSRQPYVYFQHPDGDVVVAPVETENGVVWQFTPETLNNIRAVYAAMDDMPLPPELSQAAGPQDLYFVTRGFIRGTMPALLNPLGPMEGWQWASLGLAAILGLGLGLAGSRVGMKVSHLIGWTAQDQPGTTFIIAWALRFMLFGVVMLAVIHGLGLPDPVATVATTIAWFLIVASLVPMAWQAIGVVADQYRQREGVPGRHITLVSLVAGVVRVVVLVGGVLLMAHVLSLPYQGVIAGLGIGGLAVALAAQPTLQNLLSGFTLYADKPLSVGDFCRFGDKMGTIEHIGMRSTRIRSLDRTVITVPNSEFANMQLENFAYRDRIWLSTKLQLRYETRPDQLRYVLAELRKLLIAHPKVASEPLRVRFCGFGTYSLDIDIFAYILTADINEFHAVREDLYLRMMNLIEEAGAQFAFPSAVHYQAQDQASDPERVKAAEKKVSGWRTEKRLPFPDHDWHDKAEFSNTLDYPPEGSVLAEEPEPLVPR